MSTSALSASSTSAPPASRSTSSAPFVSRHIGPTPVEQTAMARALGFADVEAFLAAAVPAALRRPEGGLASLPRAADEAAALAELGVRANANRVLRAMIGQGYSGTHLPAVLRRGVLENPGWYTQYTPYQAEISQGRLECLLTFQTLTSELTGLPVANASLLDEATAAAEAVSLMSAACDDAARTTVLIDAACHPQVIDVVRTRAAPLGVQVVCLGIDAIPAQLAVAGATIFGAVLALPGSDGVVADPRPAIAALHAAGALVAVDADLLALCVLAGPGAVGNATGGADIVFGSAQRFGVPMGFGGPHAAFFAVRDELKRLMPGRLVGVSKDRHGAPAYRLSLQTREQHIRREKATSNICTAQALLANLAALYAMWHGPEGLIAIAERAHQQARRLAGAAQAAGCTLRSRHFFDTICVGFGTAGAADAAFARAENAGYQLRRFSADQLCIACDETTTDGDVAALIAALGWRANAAPFGELPSGLRRQGPFLTHPRFHAVRSETAMLRYVKTLEARDLSLTHSMIPLGSCTMKLNAAAEMLPITWSALADLHPFAPAAHTAGYQQLFAELSAWLCAITGFAACSLQPNSGAQGEYAGLLAIRRFQAAQGQPQRNVCLIPVSAHGTNPATAAMMGLSVVAVRCDADGNVDLDDLAAKARAHAAQLCCLMITYPSTHGVFETGIRRACALIHEHGGQVYMDGANLNAQVGLTAPGDLGADVCHLNLHKTFCIPHGGGGPGMGPICVGAHLAPHLPGHVAMSESGVRGPEVPASGAVSAAPWGSALILAIPWMYIRMMGGDGLRAATAAAILNANHIARRLRPHYPVLYSGPGGLIAHECILDLRGFKPRIEAEDVAKRLMDYGFHAPTLSFPVPGTLMIEPTESEPLDELDRFCDAMIAIRAEIQAVLDGTADAKDNPLKMAPHTMGEVCADTWTHAYARETAAFPATWTRSRKFWPSVARIDAAHGDRNLICTCPPMTE